MMNQNTLDVEEGFFSLESGVDAIECKSQSLISPRGEEAQ